MRINCWGLFFVTILIIAALVLPGPASSAVETGFTDSTKVFPMTKEWEKKSIVYDTSVGQNDIVVTLDQHLYPALSPLIQKYAYDKGLKIKVNEGTCGISMGKLALKKVDVGGFCCPPGETDRLPGLRFHTVGIAALALLVHPDNPVDSITLAQARKIFSGDIHRWSELAGLKGQKGLNMPIQAVARLHCKKRPGHWKLLLENEDLFALGLLEVGSIPDMIAMVANNSRAIGYEVLWNPQRYKGEVKALKINGFSPRKTANVVSLNFPLYRTYNITTWESEKSTNPNAQDLVNYLLTKIESLDPEFGIIPASSLIKGGWKFKGAELIGTP